MMNHRTPEDHPFLAGFEAYQQTDNGTLVLRDSPADAAIMGEPSASSWRGVGRKVLEAPGAQLAVMGEALEERGFAFRPTRGAFSVCYVSADRPEFCQQGLNAVEMVETFRQKGNTYEELVDHPYAAKIGCAFEQNSRLFLKLDDADAHVLFRWESDGIHDMFNLPVSQRDAKRPYLAAQLGRFGVHDKLFNRWTRIQADHREELHALLGGLKLSGSLLLGRLEAFPRVAEDAKRTML